MTLMFDRAKHAYTLDGASVPSVSQILSDLSARDYAFVSRSVMEEAAALGTAVHKMIELDCIGRLDEVSLDYQLAPYLQSWRAFRKHSGFVPLLSEARLASRRYQFAGTLDLFGRMGGGAALVDAKRCATVPRTAGPQTAGYEVALREWQPDLVADASEGSGVINRYALHLRPGNRWNVVPLADPADTRVFLSALTLYRFNHAK